MQNPDLPRAWRGIVIGTTPLINSAMYLWLNRVLKVAVLGVAV